MNKCAYCGQLSPATREHVIPDWYCKTPGDSETFSARNPTTHLKGDLTVKDVCEKCNCGALSALDTYGKQLFEAHFSKTIYAGESVTIDLEPEKFVRWLLKLSYNSARAQNADTIVLSKFRKVMLGDEPLTEHVRVWAHLVSASIVDENANVVRAALKSESGREVELDPRWFRILQMRLPYRPISRVLQRQVMINSYAFTLLIAPLDEPIPNKELEKLSTALLVFNPYATLLPADGTAFRLQHASDHAASSASTLLANYSTRYDETPNPFVKSSLDGKTNVLFLAVTPEMLDQNDIDTIADSLTSMVATREMELAHRLRVNLVVMGFDNDPRQLWEVPQVRDYCCKLFIKCPFVFLLSHPNGSLLTLLVACWVYDPTDESPEGQQARTKDFLTRAFAGMNEVCYRLMISEETNREITEIGIKRAFGSSAPPP